MSPQTPKFHCLPGIRAARLSCSRQPIHAWLGCAAIAGLVGLASGPGCESNPHAAGVHTAALGGDAGPGSDITISASFDTWIRETAPDTVYENDLMSVWSSDSADGGRRYGLVTFDLSSLAGTTITSATLELYANADHSGNTRAIRQSASVVPGTASGATWNSYQANQASSATLLDGFRFDLLPAEHAQEYIAGTPASEPDLVLIQSAINGSGSVTLVFQAEEQGMDLRQDWSDGGLDSNPPRLVLGTATPSCDVATSVLPHAQQDSGYMGYLRHTAGCPADVEWQMGVCGLPSGMSLDASSGLLGGAPEYGGTYPLDVRLVDGQGQVLATREVALTVDGIVDTRTDLDHDGDVDTDDLDIFTSLVVASTSALHDAGIRPGVHANTNFNSSLGNIVPIEVDNAPSNPGGDAWKGYLKFDVAALETSTFSGAGLRLHTAPGFGGPSPGSLRIDVFGLRDGNDSWNESTITWNNAPANVNDAFDLDSAQVFGGAPLGTFTTTGGTDVFGSPALDAFLNTEVGADGLATIVLVVESDTGTDGDYTVFYSHEEVGQEPALLATTEGVEDGDFDGDGDVDMDDWSILSQSYTGPQSGNVDMCWRRYVETAMDTLLAVGLDSYGAVHTPMPMSVIDLQTLTAPPLPAGVPCPGEDIAAQAAGYPADACLRTEGRPEQGRLSLGGSNLWLDSPLVGTMYRLSQASGDARYGDAADAYIESVFARAVKNVQPPSYPVNQTLVWGSHSYYDAYADAAGGELWSAGPLAGAPIHEILVKQPEWDRLYGLDPAATEAAIQSIWDWHVIDKTTGLHNRHDSATGGVLDFAYSGGSFMLAFANMYNQTGQQVWLDRAELMVHRHLDAANPQTGLIPDAPNATSRFDGHHMMTSATGPYVAQLLRSYEITGQTLFLDTAIDYLYAYEQYGWDASAGTYYGMLDVDGTPQLSAASGGYDVWAPVGHVNIWRSTMYSYEFAIAAAQAAVYAHYLAPAGDKAALLQIAEHWAQAIEKALPAQPGKRFGDVLRQHLPDVDQTQGTYAENYGRAISFFVQLYHATCETTCNPAYLQRAKLLAHEAVDKLYHPSGLFRGHPAKDTYQSSDGVGFLLHALMELDALPARWRPAF